MVDDHDVIVRTVREGRICTLAVSGCLDLIAADRFLAHVARALDEEIERLVFDLGDLSFLDCSGARALAAALDAAPAGCSVIVGSVSPAVARLLDVLGMSLEQRTAVSGSMQRAPRLGEAPRPEKTPQPVRPEHLMSEALRIATAIAGTEEQLARTFAEMARQRMAGDAARLIVLSDNARGFAARNRRWVNREKQALARAAR